MWCIVGEGTRFIAREAGNNCIIAEEGRSMENFNFG